MRPEPYSDEELAGLRQRDLRPSEWYMERPRIWATLDYLTTRVAVLEAEGEDITAYTELLEKLEAEVARLKAGRE